MANPDVSLSYVPTWCPGCGNFGILNALKKALAGLDPDNTVLVTGIGCSSKIAQYINTYRIETLHGRALPVATGIKLANHRLKVIVNGGDGDGMGLGMGHFIHTARRNPDIAYFIHNNQIYGLTKGQPSPTSDQGMVTKFSPPPSGNMEQPVNIVRQALTAGATFVARSFTTNLEQLAELMIKAIEHPGFAVVDILQPCVSFNKWNTYQWYQQRVTPVEALEGYDPADRRAAITLSEEWGGRIPTGLFYQELRPTLEGAIPQLAETPLARQPLEDINVAALMQQLR
ncbi:MAG TPA: 2-oxoacid:ferredoxin oxidoreductase subunit beta [Selenomonadales bacterium]|nr:2-oxoacid:ferredoxin oxidoreductase subunit beta [Selenomonadales bacterium]